MKVSSLCVKLRNNSNTCFHVYVSVSLRREIYHRIYKLDHGYPINWTNKKCNSLMWHRSVWNKFWGPSELLWVVSQWIWKMVISRNIISMPWGLKHSTMSVGVALFARKSSHLLEKPYQKCICAISLNLLQKITIRQIFDQSYRRNFRQVDGPYFKHWATWFAIQKEYTLIVTDFRKCTKVSSSVCTLTSKWLKRGFLLQ